MTIALVLRHGYSAELSTERAGRSITAVRCCAVRLRRSTKHSFSSGITHVWHSALGRAWPIRQEQALEQESAQTLTDGRAAGRGASNMQSLRGALLERESGGRLALAAQTGSFDTNTACTRWQQGHVYSCTMIDERFLREPRGQFHGPQPDSVFADFPSESSVLSARHKSPHNILVRGRQLELLGSLAEVFVLVRVPFTCQQPPRGLSTDADSI